MGIGWKLEKSKCSENVRKFAETWGSSEELVDECERTFDPEEKVPKCEDAIKELKFLLELLDESEEKSCVKNVSDLREEIEITKDHVESVLKTVKKRM